MSYSSASKRSGYTSAPKPLMSQPTQAPGAYPWNQEAGGQQDTGSRARGPSGFSQAQGSYSGYGNDTADYNVHGQQGGFSGGGQGGGGFGDLGGSWIGGSQNTADSRGYWAAISKNGGDFGGAANSRSSSSYGGPTSGNGGGGFSGAANSSGDGGSQNKKDSWEYWAAIYKNDDGFDGAANSRSSSGFGGASNGRGGRGFSGVANSSGGDGSVMSNRGQGEAWGFSQGRGSGQTPSGRGGNLNSGGRGGNQETYPRNGPNFNWGAGQHQRGMEGIQSTRGMGRGGMGLMESGVSSLGDLATRAKQKVSMGTTGAMTHIIKAFQMSLATNLVNKANNNIGFEEPISAMEDALYAAMLPDADLRYEGNFLCQVDHYVIHTGVLYLNRIYQGNVVQSIFLARGMGSSCAKTDTYKKAYELLMTTKDSSEILYQEDFGHQALIEEVQGLYAQDPRGFIQLLQKSSFVDRPDAGLKRGGFDVQGGGPSAKMSRMEPLMRGPMNSNIEPLSKEDLWRDPHSLKPKKNVRILMDASEPLVKKLEKLKELLKEVGITKLHIVPKIDQNAFKTSINIKNVYRFVEVPSKGMENRTPVFCELYFDNVFMAAGDPDHQRNTAMHNVYSTLADMLFSKALDFIAGSRRNWYSHYARDADIADVIVKQDGEDNNTLLSSNLANMKQMMHCMPDLSTPVDKLVLTEHDADKNRDNCVFKWLELSATRNCMLLEVEITRNVEDMTFTCIISLQGKQLYTQTHGTKNMAKRLCAEAIMKEMMKTHDYIYVHKESVGHTITKAELVAMARDLKAAGDQSEAFDPTQQIIINAFCLHSLTPTEPKKAQVKARTDREIEEQERNADQERIENLPENVALRPLLPWMATALCQLLEEYYSKITLEDVNIDIRDMSKSQFEIITHAAERMGLRTRTKGSTTYLMRRADKAQDMLKILQLCPQRKSGRYELIKLFHPSTPEELEEFKKEFIAKFEDMANKRFNPDFDPTM